MSAECDAAIEINGAAPSALINSCSPKKTHCRRGTFFARIHFHAQLLFARSAASNIQRTPALTELRNLPLQILHVRTPRLGIATPTRVSGWGRECPARRFNLAVARCAVVSSNRQDYLGR